MLDTIIEKLDQFVDAITGKWHQLTDGKRGEDDFSGLLWLIGILLLLIDIFVKKVGLLVVGLLFIIYAFVRCFSPLRYHDYENAVLLGVGRFTKRLCAKLGLKVSDKVKDFKEADKKAMMEQIKDKVIPDEQTKLERAEQKAMKEAYYIFDCPGCKQKVRIPNRGKKGRVAIVCPACQTRFVRMRW